MTKLQSLNAINNRVWYVEGGVHPSRPPIFLAIGKFADDPAVKIGEAKKVSAPDPNNFNRDIQVGTIQGERERATLSLGIRSTFQKSILLDLKNKNCRVDVFALSGLCGNPQDFTEGGEKWVYFPDGKIGGHGYENFGAYGLDENNPTNEKVDMTAEDYWEFLYMSQDQVGSSVTTREILTVDVYRGQDCDDCPDPISKVFLTMAGASATPGTLPSLLYTDDAGETWASQNITTLFSNENPTDAQIIGSSFVLISNTANEIHWTDTEEVFQNANTWNQVNTGFVVNKNPNAMWAVDVRHLWIVGNGGYVYFAKNYKVKVEVQDAGIATTQHLRSVHAFDNQNILAVGDSNAVIYSKNGGSTWEAVTGPSVGINMAACWMWDEDTWFVGEGANGNGKFWYTINRGISWVQVALPAAYLRFDRIFFVSEAEGYISARAGGQSYILRTITAGNEWVVLPNGKKAVSVPNSYLRDLAVTNKFANTVYAAGLASNGTAGIVLKMTA